MLTKYSSHQYITYFISTSILIGSWFFLLAWEVCGWRCDVFCFHPFRSSLLLHIHFHLYSSQSLSDTSYFVTRSSPSPPPRLFLFLSPSSSPILSFSAFSSTMCIYIPHDVWACFDLLLLVVTGPLPAILYCISPCLASCRTRIFYASHPSLFYSHLSLYCFFPILCLTPSVSTCIYLERVTGYWT